MSAPTSLMLQLKQRTARWIAAAVLTLSLSTAALAHPGHPHPGYEDVDEFDEAQMVNGFLHPFTGLDHLLLAVAMGWMAFAAGRRKGTAITASFLGSMALGLLLGCTVLRLPVLEEGLALSVVAAGLLIAFAVKQRRHSSLGFAVLAGFWHGNAHGAEMAASAPALALGSMMLLGTASLCAVGAGFHALVAQRQEPLGRWIGAALAVAGAWFWMA